MREVISNTIMGFAGSGLVNIAFYLTEVDRVVRDGEIDWFIVGVGIMLGTCGMAFAVLAIARLWKDTFRH